MKSPLLFVYLPLAALYAGCILTFVLLAAKYKGRVTRLGLSSFLGAGLIAVNLVSFYFSDDAGEPWWGILRLAALLVLLPCTLFWNAPQFRFFSLRFLPLGLIMAAAALGVSLVFNLALRGLPVPETPTALWTAVYSVVFPANFLFSMGMHFFLVLTRRNDPRAKNIRREVIGVAGFDLIALALVAGLAGSGSTVPDYLVYDFAVGFPFACFGNLYLGHLFVKASRSGSATYYDLLKMLNYFTPQEAALVDRVLLGQSNKTIAYDLGQAEDTIKKRLGKVLKRLKIASRPQLIKLLRSH